MHAECILTGHDGAKETYFCIFCTATKEEMRDRLGAIIGIHCSCPIAPQHQEGCQFFFKLKTEGVPEDLRCSGHANCKGCRNTPIWPFAQTTSRIYCDVCHWAMALARCMSDGFLAYCPVSQRKEMAALFKSIGLKVTWSKDKDGGKEKRTKFFGNALHKLITTLDMEKAMSITGKWSADDCKLAADTCITINRLILAAGALDGEDELIEPAHFKVLADMAIRDLCHLYGPAFCAYYTHSTTDHMASMMEALRARGPFTLHDLSCEAVELRNQVCWYFVLYFNLSFFVLYTHFVSGASKPKTDAEVKLATPLTTWRWGGPPHGRTEGGCQGSGSETPGAA